MKRDMEVGGASRARRASLLLTRPIRSAVQTVDAAALGVAMSQRPSVSAELHSGEAEFMD